MVEGGGVRNERVAVLAVDAVGGHDAVEHVVAELHRGSGRLFLGGFGFSRCFDLSVVVLDFVAEDGTVEGVEEIGVDLTLALDHVRDVDALRLANAGQMPDDGGARGVGFLRHLDVFEQFLVGANVASVHLVAGWDDVLQLHVSQRRVAVVLEEDEHLVAATAADLEGLLPGREVTAVVHHADRRSGFNVTLANRTEAFATELTPDGCIHALVLWRGVGGHQVVGHDDLLAWCHADGALAANGEGQGVTCTVGAVVFAFKRDAFADFSLELLRRQGLPRVLDLQGRSIHGVEHARNIVGEAHQVDVRRTGVGDLHLGLNRLFAVRVELGLAVGLLHLAVHHREVACSHRQGAFRGCAGAGQNGVGEFPGQVRLLGRSHADRFGPPFTVGCHVFVDVAEVEQEFVAALQAGLELDQIDGEGRAVLEDRRHFPRVGSLAFNGAHVRKAATEGVEVLEVHGRQGGIGTVGGHGRAAGNRVLAVDAEGSTHHDGAGCTGGKHANLPRQGAIVDGRMLCFRDVHAFRKRAGDDHVMQVGASNVAEFNLHRDGVLRAHRQGERALLVACRVGVEALSHHEHVSVGNGVLHDVLLARFKFLDADDVTFEVRGTSIGHDGIHVVDAVAFGRVRQGEGSLHLLLGHVAVGVNGGLFDFVDASFELVTGDVVHFIGGSQHGASNDAGQSFLGGIELVFAFTLHTFNGECGGQVRQVRRRGGRRKERVRSQGVQTRRGRWSRHRQRILGRHVHAGRGRRCGRCEKCVRRQRVQAGRGRRSWHRQRVLSRCFKARRCRRSRHRQRVLSGHVHAGRRGRRFHAGRSRRSWHRQRVLGGHVHAGRSRGSRHRQRVLIGHIHTRRGRGGRHRQRVLIGHL